MSAHIRRAMEMGTEQRIDDPKNTTPPLVVKKGLTSPSTPTLKIIFFFSADFAVGQLGLTILRTPTVKINFFFWADFAERCCWRWADHFS